MPAFLPSSTGNYEMTETPPDSRIGSQEDILRDKQKEVHDNVGFNGSATVDSSHVNLDVDQPPKKDEDDGDDEYEDEDDENYSSCSKMVASVQSGFWTAYNDHKHIFWTIIYIKLAILYFIYFGFAMAYSYGDEGSIRLLVITVIATVFIILTIIWCHWSKQITAPFRLCRDSCKSRPTFDKERTRKILRWLYILFMVSYAVFAIVWLIVDVGLNNPENLISAAGIAFFVLTFYIFSHNPAKVKWRPVLWGLYIQFAFALIILRWDWGFQAFHWLGERVQEFLAHSDDGATFVFGKLEVHFFAFKVLPVVVFFSTMVSVLYYLGVMQFVIRHIARTMALVMGTSACESLNAAGNIFIGQSESPLMIRPFIQRLTKSELHAVITGGFATIAGSVMAAYISYGVPPNHLIAASVMSAPAALAMSKLFYPETKKIVRNDEDVYKMQNMEHNNIIAAASEGASTSIKLVANIAANLIAFIAVKHFVNATLTWFGHRVGLFDPELTFELICSYVFWPLAFLMGVHHVDCRIVAKLIGIKTFVNEFVAYVDLSTYIKNRATLHDYVRNMTLFGWDNGTFTHVGEDIYLNATDTTLVGGILEDRSEVIATYALCGFSNIGSMGIMIGALAAMAPNRRKDITSVVVRALIAGNVACFITACIAGLLYRPRFDVLFATNSTL